MLRKLWPALLTLAAASIALIVVLSGMVCVTGRPLWDLAWIFGAMNVLMYASIRWKSGWKTRKQVTVLIMFFGLQLIGYFSVRLEGLMGDGRPNLQFVWQETPQEQFTIFEDAGVDDDGVGRVAKKQMSAAEYKEYVRKKKQRFIPDKADSSVDLSRVSPQDSPGFRGADRSGVYPHIRLSKDWKSRPPELVWRHPVGPGWSTFAVVNGFAVTQEQRGGFEAVVCYELKSGKLCWEQLDQAYFSEGSSAEGPRATPTIFEGRVYALGATGVLNCLEGSTGKVIWKRNILDEHQVENRIFGMVGSPLLVDDKVIVCPGAPGASVVAYHRLTGKKLWGGGDATSSYSSPQLETLGGRKQILNFNAEGIYSHALETGEVLWSYPWISNPPEKNNVCQPICFSASQPDQPSLMYLASGYGRGCAMFSIENKSGTFSIQPIWMTKSMKAKFTNAVHYQGFIYGLDENILVCVNPKTGAREWRDGRYGWGQLILAGDLLVIQAESGEVAIVEANPRKYEPLYRFKALDHRTCNHACIIGDLLLTRNDREAACYRIPTADKPK